MDEAGNNLDIPTLTILEDYLNSFSGIVIAVSHDRYFLDNIADRILAMDGNGHVTQYEGGYTDYLEAKKKRMASDDGAEDAGKNEKIGKAAQTATGKSSKDWKQDQPQKLKFSYKEQREYETIDDDIASLEEKLDSIERQIEANATNSVKLKELLEEQEKVRGDLDEKMERWVYLNDLAERIEEQG